MPYRKPVCHRRGRATLALSGHSIPGMPSLADAAQPPGFGLAGGLTGVLKLWTHQMAPGYDGVPHVRERE